MEGTLLSTAVLVVLIATALLWINLSRMFSKRQKRSETHDHSIKQIDHNSNNKIEEDVESNLDEKNN